MSPDKKHNGVMLNADARYWRDLKEHPELIKEHTGGCGPGGYGDYLVPDKFLGLSMFPPCQIHDYDYWRGLTAEEKDIADRRFRNNMVRTINHAYENPGWFMSKMPKIARKELRNRRRNMAELYYQSVHKFGGSSFWDGKNEKDTMGLATDIPERLPEMTP